MSSISRPSLAVWLPGFCYLSEWGLLTFLPFSPKLTPVLGLLWACAQIGLLAFLLFVRREQLDGRSNVRIIGQVIALLGVLSYLANPLTVALGLKLRFLLPAGALFSAIGFTIIGVNIARARRLAGGWRYSILGAGLYPFAVMFPVLLLTGHPNTHAIMLWGLPWLIVAYGVSSQAQAINSEK